MKKAALILTFISLSLFAQSTFQSENMLLVGRAPEGVSLSVTAIPGYVFTNNGAVFEVYGYVDDELAKIGETVLHGPITDIFVSPTLNLAFATAENFGFEIIDITDKTNPQVVGNYPLEATSQAVYVFENYPDGARAFVLTDYEGLFVFDVSTPSNPELLSTFETYMGGQDLFGDGWNYKLYAAVEENGFEIIDISNPNQLQRLGRKETGGRAMGIYVQDNIAYVADYFNKIRLYDIGEPASINYIGYYSTPGLTYDIVVYDTLAIVADGTAGVEFIDLTEQRYPYPGVVDGTAYSVFYCPSNGKVYTAAYEGGLWELDASNGNVVSSFPAKGNSISLNLTNNNLHVATGFDGYAFFDVSEAANPQLISIYNEDILYARDVAVVGNYAYLANGTEGIKVLNIENPDNISLETEVSISSGSARKIFTDVADNKIYVACSFGGVRIYDISTPSSPELIGSFNTAYSAQDIWVENGYAYVADYLDGMEVWDVSDPSNIVGVATTDQPVNGMEVFKKDNYVFLSGLVSGVRIIDCSDLNNVHEVAYIRTTDYSNSYAAFVDDNYIYIADGRKGVHVVDYENFDSPQVVGYFQTGGRARDIWVDEEKNIYVADENDGIYILRYVAPDGIRECGGTAPADFVLEQNYPNPFNPVTTIKYTVPSVIASAPYLSGERSNLSDGQQDRQIATNLTSSNSRNDANVQLVVYDILGREVATLVNQRQAPGNYSVQFDASNLPSGTYFYTLRVGNFAATKKMILLK